MRRGLGPERGLQFGVPRRRRVPARVHRRHMLRAHPSGDLARKDLAFNISVIIT